MKFDKRLCSTNKLKKKQYEHLNLQSYGFETLWYLQHDLLSDIKKGLRQQHTELKMVTWVKSVATAIKYIYQQNIVIIEISDKQTFHSDG